MEIKNLLSNLLKSRNISSVNELDPEEKKTFENYERILSKEKITVSDFENFLKTQIGIIESKWQDLTIAQPDKAWLIPYHTCYSVLLKVITAPDVERKNLEDYLIQLTNQ